LALAARHGLEVVDYEDAAEGRMEVVDGGLQFVEVVLRPRVTIAAASDADKATRLHSKAHEECFIARSVAFEVRNEPVIERLGEG
ncbi:MAG: OsmC family protein, partial [Myxococcales bacterium]|nr:OsmC family protein [Myxococcales bacterium]